MAPEATLKDIAKLFLKLGFIGFGGPAAHIAMMQHEIVTKRKWLTEQHFLDLIGATNLIPGPNSTEMAIHIGHEKSGWKGLIIAGLCFILPAVFITGVFAWLYKEDGKFIRETIARTGAFIMGKRMFEKRKVSWPNDLYKADVYVLTHQVREPWVQEGSTAFYFINDGIESALEKARTSANGKDIRIQGGANTIQQFLNAGLVDDFFLHLAPVFLGGGIRLFDGIDKNKYDLQIEDVIPSKLTTHLRYKLTKK
jgi:dihydrofolate reductase